MTLRQLVSSLIITFGLAVGLALPLAAQEDPIQVCRSFADRAASLEACDRVLSDSGQPGYARVEAYGKRALYRALDGEFLRARDELTAAMTFAGPGTENAAFWQLCRAIVSYFDARENNSGSYSAAVADLDDAIAAFDASDKPEARLFLLVARGIVKTGMGDNNGALIDLEQAQSELQAARDPIAKRIFGAVAHYGLGEVRFRMGDTARASEELIASLELVPANPWALELMTEVAARQGDKQQAAKYAALAMSAWHWITQIPAVTPEFLGSLRNAKLLETWRARDEQRFAEIVEGKLERTAVAPSPADIANKTVFSGPPATLGRRVALVIGNAQYSQQVPLRNPVNDAKRVSAALNRLGFEVIEGINLDGRDLSDKLHDFARRVPGADVGLVYYAGHAIQYNGVNYLVPVDAELRDETDVDHSLQSVETVLRDLSRAAKVRVLILDACRDNPLQQRLAASLPGSRSLSTGRGLARLANQADGFIVVYATGSGQVAEDGTSDNSPFARALLQHMETRGLEIVQLFKRVAQTVKDQTAGRQSPELSLSFTDEVYLAGQ